MIVFAALWFCIGAASYLAIKWVDKYQYGPSHRTWGGLFTGALFGCVTLAMAFAGALLFVLECVCSWEIWDREF